MNELLVSSHLVTKLSIGVHVISGVILILERERKRDEDKYYEDRGERDKNLPEHQ